MTHYRQTGCTTQQINEAPKGAVFVWVNSDIGYPKRLAWFLGRHDLKIVERGWLLDGVRGCRVPVRIDHAFHDVQKASDKEWEAIDYLRSKGRFQ